MPSILQEEFDEKDIIGDILAQKPEPENHLGASVIVDGCPIVGPAKYELLKKFITDKFEKAGPITECDFPITDTDQTTKGYMFITYESSKIASKAIKMFNNSPLDKTHTLQVTSLSDYERAVNAPTEWNPPPVQEFTDHGNLSSWLLNESCRDQFAVVMADGDTAIHWHSTLDAPLVQKRESWTERWVQWSPRGTYLATCHQQGVILWGGDQFLRIGRFPHAQVALLDFSPMEKFIVTRSRNTTVPPDNLNRPMCDVVISDVRRNIRRRDFTLPMDSQATSFRWSYNDSYFACLRDGCINVYETDNFCLLDKQRIGNGNIRDFAWSPVENLLAYWVPEADNVPARVAVMELPSRRELCSKNLFSVADIDLCWHKQGNFLASQVLRCFKKKIDNDKQVKYVGTYTNIEVIRMREKLYPVDQLDVKSASSVNCLQWEPNGGSRFAFIQTSANNKSTLSIYDVPRESSVREVASIEVPTARFWYLNWSPKGNLLLVAGPKCAEGWIHLVSANDAALIGKAEHPMFNELHWDPTGRYFASVVSSMHQKNDNSIWFWTCIGRFLTKMPFTGLRTFAWRPRPPTLVPEEQLQRLGKNMAKYNRIFATEDRALTSKASRDLYEQRQRMLTQFNEWSTKLARRYETDKKEATKDQPQSDLDQGEVVEEVEVLIGSTKELVAKAEGGETEAD